MFVPVSNRTVHWRFMQFTPSPGLRDTHQHATLHTRCPIQSSQQSHDRPHEPHPRTRAPAILRYEPCVPPATPRNHLSCSTLISPAPSARMCAPLRARGVSAAFLDSGGTLCDCMPGWWAVDSTYIDTRGAWWKLCTTETRAPPARPITPAPSCSHPTKQTWSLTAPPPPPPPVNKPHSTSAIPQVHVSGANHGSHNPLVPVHRQLFHETQMCWRDGGV